MNSLLSLTREYKSFAMIRWIYLLNPYFSHSTIEGRRSIEVVQPRDLSADIYILPTANEEIDGDVS